MDLFGNYGNSNPNTTNTVQNLTKAKVTLVLGLTIVVIAMLYFFGIFQSIPCGDANPIYTFSRNLIHVEWAHLLTNLWVLISFIPLELTLGAPQFLTLVIILLLFQTGIEWIVSKFIDLKCSIGLSGLLFGLFTWTLLDMGTVEPLMLVSIIAAVIVPSLMDKRVSLSGHLIGVVAGVLAVPVTRLLGFTAKPKKTNGL